MAACLGGCGLLTAFPNLGTEVFPSRSIFSGQCVAGQRLQCELRQCLTYNGRWPGGVLREGELNNAVGSDREYVNLSGKSASASRARAGQALDFVAGVRYGPHASGQHPRNGGADDEKACHDFNAWCWGIARLQALQTPRLTPAHCRGQAGRDDASNGARP